MSNLFEPLNTFKVTDIITIIVLGTLGLLLEIVTLFFSNEVIPKAPPDFLILMFVFGVFCHVFMVLVVVESANISTKE